MWRFFYNLLLPAGFIAFIPGLIWKYRTRPGWKSTFAERFGRFSPERVSELKAFHGGVWVHAVSVGETVAAMSMIKAFLAENPEGKAVISTTTTTGQELARRQAPDRVAVIFCPVDFKSFVRRTLEVIRPSKLVIFETEIWPNMVAEAHNAGIPVALVNARMSDRSAKGYRRARCFFGPLLKLFNVIAAQSEADAERYLSVSPQANVTVTGNLKFDQDVPESLEGIDLAPVFGEGDFTVIAAASTHPGEEKLAVQIYRELRKELPSLRLILIPRHAERGAELAEMLADMNMTFVRRSLSQRAEKPADVLLADTTGEMLKLMKSSHIVIMGKSLAGHDEGHNLIEPALLGKPIVTGAVLRNFRFVLDVLKSENAVCTVSSGEELAEVLKKLASSGEMRAELGNKARSAIRRHSGAVRRTLDVLSGI